MSANIRETRIALGYKYQTGVQAINNVADIISLNKQNEALANVELVSEDDANWLGKGHEFATQNFLSHWNVSVPFEKFMTSEFMAILFAFGLGKIVETSPGTGAHQYVCTPQDPVTDEINAKPITIVEAIRQGGSDVFDRGLIGCCLEDFNIQVQSGPGLNNSKVTANFVGCGKHADPSGLAIPAITAEHILQSAGVTATINTVDYVTARNLISCEIGWKQNIRLDSGFYPGSGFQTTGDPSTGAIRGRMEFGNRELTCRFIARFENGSTELATLLAQTSGTATIAVQGALITGAIYHKITVVIQKSVFKTAVIGSSDGIVNVAVEIKPLYDSVNGLVSMTAITGIAGIGTAGT